MFRTLRRGRLKYMNHRGNSLANLCTPISRELLSFRLDGEGFGEAVGRIPRLCGITNQSNRRGLLRERR